ncbi:hypothetical protein HAX54_025050 [Datura stramonium]|uniref:Uncharacterized protein n=1 Tax=Datura stramonium TaxID=4076 RepID=A0ABS8UZ58_DATST|nr:hypothetical protein [Datura stramonium]
MLNTVYENSTNESNQSQEELVEELGKFKMEIVKVNKSQEALEKKVEAQFVEMKQCIVDSNFKFIKDIKVLLDKGDFEGTLQTDQVSEEPSSSGPLRQGISAAVGPLWWRVSTVVVRVISTQAAMAGKWSLQWIHYSGKLIAAANTES